LELFGRDAHVIDPCGLVLGTFNKHANWQESDDMLAELSARLLDAVGAALGFDPREGGKLYQRAVSDDVATAGHMGNSSLGAMCRLIPSNAARSEFIGQVGPRNGGGQQCDQANRHAATIGLQDRGFFCRIVVLSSRSEIRVRAFTTRVRGAAEAGW
jgi:hypothetical protein